MSYTYQIEPMSTVIEEIKPLLMAHWQEIATNKKIKPLDPDYERYKSLEEVGVLRLMTLRFSGTLCGYFISFIMPHIHYRQTMYAMNDIMYVSPKHRGGSSAYRLIKHSIDDLRERGVDILTISMKVDYPFRGGLTKLGFSLKEENWDLVL